MPPNPLKTGRHVGWRRGPANSARYRAISSNATSSRTETSKHVMIEETKEGLNVEIVDQDGRARGSAHAVKLRSGTEVSRKREPQYFSGWRGPDSEIPGLRRPRA